MQGVGFRASLAQEAASFPKLVGYVRNRRDGRVEALIQGSEAEVERLIAWCYRGPSRAQVAKVEIQTELVGSEYVDFSVKTDEE